MVNFLWGLMIVLSVIVSIVCSNQLEVTNALLLGAKDGINLVIKLLGTMCLWNGLMNIAKESGLDKKIAKLFCPALRLIFPKIKDMDTLSAISMNVSANVLGLGNAATPLGLTAMNKLQNQNPHKSLPTHEMILFVIMNTASITVIPTTVGMLRQEYGVKSPFDIVLPVVITSIVALTLALSMANIVKGIIHYE